MSRGRFITLEGGEGSGKSTQALMLVDFLAEQGIKAIATREVGGAEGAEDIRRLWLEKPQGFWDEMTEVMLIMAARREHLAKTVWPALEEGKWVVSDRFVDSTRAYQGIGMNLGVEKIDSIYQQIAGDFWPSLTLILDLPIEIGLTRMKERSENLDRYEKQALPFHETLRRAFLTFAAQEPERFRVIDASKTEAEVEAEIQRVVRELI